MNEHQLGRLLRRLVLLSAPLPLAVLGAACGGATSTVDDGSGGTTAEGGTDTAGTASGGSRASAGMGGAVAKAGAGTGGSTAGAGTSGTSGTAGAGMNPCRGMPSQTACTPNQNTVPKSCIGSGEDQIGTTLSLTECTEICANNGITCSVVALTDSLVTVECQSACAVGRRPAGLGEPSTCDTRAVGPYFADIAYLEAASVAAFRTMRDELRAKGAPKKLVRAAARAARDEIRHARTTGALARRFGAQPRVPVIAAMKPRSLEAMALENAVEGCVRETYGALLATRQATLATDPLVRAAMMRIARDETRHASLSLQVGRWLETRLAPAAKRNVARAKQAAAAELIGALANEPEVSFAALAGLPSATEATGLASQLQRELWS